MMNLAPHVMSFLLYISRLLFHRVIENCAYEYKRGNEGRYYPVEFCA